MRDVGVVGRELEFDVLAAALERARVGDGTFSLVAGPAGIGKTHLADALAAHARASGVAVCWASCWEGATPPLWPWSQLLRAAGAAELAPAETPFARFDAIVRRLQAEAAARPALLVVDDLHHADADSLRVLDLLVRQRRGHRQAIVATCRLDAAGPDLLGVARRAEVVELSGLDLPSAARLVAAAGLRAGSALVARLHDASGGNPFFLLELARAVARDGPRPDGLPPLPPSVVEVIRRNLAGLDPPARRVVFAAAVQGREFEPAAVAAALGAPRAEVDAALAAAAGAGIVTPSPPHDRFAHALTVDAVAGLLDPGERRRLHLASAQASSAPERVASHLLAAGDLADLDAVVGACREAARIARSAWAHAEAARHLSAAAGECARRGQPRAELLLELCDAQKAARDLAGARESALAVARLARGRGDGHLLARAALAMPPDAEGIEVDQLADPEQIALREEALVRPPADDATAARLMAGLALSLYWAGGTGDRAVDHRATAVRRDQLSGAAVERARRAGDEATLAFCLGARLYALWGPDAPPGRGELVAELVALSERLGDGALRLEALGWVAVDAMVRGDHGRALAAVAEHARLAEARHDPAARWASLRWQASLALSEARLAEAEALAVEAARLGRDVVGPRAAELFAMVPIGMVRALQGRLGESYELVRATAGDASNVPAWRTGFVVTALAAGDRDAAGRELRALSEGRFSALPRDLDWLSSLVYVAPAVRELADREAAAALVELLEPHADDHAIVGLGSAPYGPVRRAIALARETLGDRAGAEADLRAALARLDPAHEVHRGLCQADLQRVLSAPAGRRALLRDDGDRWVVRGPTAAHERSLRPQRGLAVLRELLRAGCPVDALDLLWAVEPPGDPDPAVRAVLSARRGEPLIDDTARRAYGRRLAELRSELDSADEAGDAGRSAAAAAELTALDSEVRRATGLGSRPRRAPDATERARTRVTKLLRRAVAAVASVDEPLGDHLRRSVRTGTVCAYEPDAGDRLDWDLG